MSLASEKKKWFAKNKAASQEEIFEAGYYVAIKLLNNDLEQLKDDSLEIAEQLISQARSISYKLSKLTETNNE